MENIYPEMATDKSFKLVMPMAIYYFRVKAIQPDFSVSIEYYLKKKKSMEKYFLVAITLTLSNYSSFQCWCEV